MEKSLIEKELEFKKLTAWIEDFGEHEPIGRNKMFEEEVWLTREVISALQKVREELRKNANCYTSGIHICEKHPEDCDLKVDWEVIDKALGK